MSEPSVSEAVATIIASVSDPTAAYLAARMRARSEHRSPRCWGLSSDALVLYAVGEGPRPMVPGTPEKGRGHSWRGDECGRNYPMDESDLLACEISYTFAPSDLAQKMLPVLQEFRRWVRQDINRYGVRLPR